MNNTLRLVLGIIAGAAVGMVVNGGIISISGSVIPTPEGVDPNDLND